jgi:hypothetical protein
MSVVVWGREELLAAPGSHSEQDSNEVPMTELLAHRSLPFNLQFRTQQAGK